MPAQPSPEPGSLHSPSVGIRSRLGPRASACISEVDPVSAPVCGEARMHPVAPRVDYIAASQPDCLVARALLAACLLPEASCCSSGGTEILDDRLPERRFELVPLWTSPSARPRSDAGEDRSRPRRTTRSTPRRRDCGPGRQSTGETRYRRAVAAKRCCFAGLLRSPWRPRLLRRTKGYLRRRARLGAIPGRARSRRPHPTARRAWPPSRRAPSRPTLRAMSARSTPMRARGLTSRRRAHARSTRRPTPSPES